ncbi:MAG: bifunctional pyr operon transcriptional regulator/uracil phosphoribosyltransferase PyrR [Planctomycetota bacterium]|nr:bifunctional pyr operon transcriptional regulator/uracil phosphoribosyltransferase PyrR [Planctomycetota bacterium]
MKRKLTAQQLAAALDRLTKAVLAAVPEEGPIAVIGIRTRGETLAQRLVDRLQAARGDLHIDRGVLDITFYRDDLGTRDGAPLVRATEIDFDINDAWVLLVDDVLHTGRSIRAALDAIHDFGRPRLVRLAVLIDRLGRELPIAADFVGRKLSAPGPQRIQVLLKENDGKEGVFIVAQD